MNDARWCRARVDGRYQVKVKIDDEEGREVRYDSNALLGMRRCKISISGANKGLYRYCREVRIWKWNGQIARWSPSPYHPDSPIPLSHHAQLKNTQALTSGHRHA
jgi:hypothetical protein